MATTASRSFRPSVGVVGAGRAGIALAHVIAGSGHDVVLYSTIPQRAATLRQSRRLKQIIPELDALHRNVTVTTDAAELADRCTLVLLTLSEGLLVRVLNDLGDVLDGAHMLVHMVHSLYGNDLLRCSQVIESETCVKQIGAVAGPLHVSELLAGKPNAVVAASEFGKVVEEVTRVMQTDNLLVYGESDLRGVESAAALHQLVTLAIGMADGLELGSATHASLAAVGLREITSLGTRLGASERTFYGLAGVGRLVDALQRGEPNYDLGMKLAVSTNRDEALESAPPEARSVEVVRQIRGWAQRTGARLPMTETLFRIVQGQLSPEEGLRDLMSDRAVFTMPVSRAAGV